MNVVSGATGWTRIAGASDATPITVFPAAAADAAALCNAASNTIVFTAD
jgi:hypothetical protein